MIVRAIATHLRHALAPSALTEELAQKLAKERAISAALEAQIETLIMENANLREVIAHAVVSA